MSSARSGATAVLLSDGRVLIAGGSDANGPVNSIELLGTDGGFSTGQAMHSPRSGHTATLLQDGRVLVTGGTTSGGGITNSAEIYDPAADTWTSVSAAMVDARSGHTASLLQDGGVLLAGGQNSGGAVSSLEIFDPAADGFSSAGVMSSPRMNHAASVLRDGRILIVGGSDGTNPLNTSDIYDPSSGSVSVGANLSVARTSTTATGTLDGKVVVIGGNNGSTDLASAEIYDPSTGQFSLAGASLATARSSHQAFLLPNNNSILVVGGSSSGTDLNSAELYYPWADTFQPTGAMSTTRPGFAGSALSVDGHLLAAGGTGLASTELYGFATVKTDAADYPPGTTVNISGSGWQPGETVTFTLVEVPYYDSHGPFTSVADSSGNVSNSSFVTDTYDASIKFFLTAAGSQSGLQAQNAFTDAGAANVNFATSGLPNGAPITVTILSYTNNGGQVKTNVAVAFTTPGPSANTGTQPNSTLSYSFPSSITISGTTYDFSSGSPASGFATGANQTTTTVTGTYVPGCTPPSITTSPAGATKSVGDSVTFSVTATGTSPSYQWRFNGAPISGATGSSYTISSVALSDAGSYDVVVSGSCGTVTSTAATLIVNKKTQTITFGALSDKTYGDADFTVSATASSGLTVTFTASGQCTVSGTTVHITGAGSCTITAHQAGDSMTWAAATDVAQSFNTAAKSLTASIINNPTKPYDGNTTATLTAANYSLSGLVGSDSITVTKTSGSYNSKDVATASTVTVSLVAADFTAGGSTVLTNYVLPTSASGAGHITAVTVTASMVGDPTKPYDGNTNATLTTANFSLSGVVAGESISVSKTSGTYNSKDVVTANTVTTSLVVADFTAGVGTLVTNYVLPTSASGPGHITAVTVTASIIGDPTKPYDGNTNATLTAANFSLSGVVAGESISVSKTSGTYNSKDVATANTVTVNLLAGDFTAGGSTVLTNYVLPTSASGAGHITAVTVTASIIGDPTKPYDGNTNATLTAGNFSLSGLVGSDSFTVTKTTGTYNSADVVTANTVTTSLAAGDFTAGVGTLLTNYVLPPSASGPGHITPVTPTVTVTFSSSPITYDGNPHPASAEVTGVGGADLSNGHGKLTITYIPGGGSAPVNAGSYTASAQFVSTDGNYNNATSSTPASLTMNQAPSTTVVSGGGTFVYDGMPHAATVSVTGTGGLNLTFAPVYSGDCAAAPINVPDTPCTASYTYAGDLNHTSSSGSTTITITKANQTITWNPPANMTFGTPLSSTQLNATVVGVSGGSAAGALTYTPGAGTVLPVGSQTLQVTAAATSNYNPASKTVTIMVLYSTGACDGDAGHQILQPINFDGTSVFKWKSIVPAKFRVCDANGVSIGTAGVVSMFMLAQTINGTVTQTVDETVASTTPDTAFRWDPTSQQWIFNISTKGLIANVTYVYQITLNDGSRISFQYGLK